MTAADCVVKLFSLTVVNSADSLTLEDEFTVHNSMHVPENYQHALLFGFWVVVVDFTVYTGDAPQYEVWVLGLLKFVQKFFVLISSCCLHVQNKSVQMKRKNTTKAL